LADGKVTEVIALTDLNVEDYYTTTTIIYKHLLLQNEKKRKAEEDAEVREDMKYARNAKVSGTPKEKPNNEATTSGKPGLLRRRNNN
jgi:hypothetical protein